jgi:hypothetical protein
MVLGTSAGWSSVYTPFATASMVPHPTPSKQVNLYEPRHMYGGSKAVSVLWCVAVLVYQGDVQWLLLYS